MSKIKIEIPAAFSFKTLIPVRITDLNYGGHVGNDSILSMMHEARMQFLKHHGYTEMNFGGTGLIMSDVGIEFKNEVFYGDTITASVCAGDFSKVSFDIYYKFEKEQQLIALAKTGMVCFDYTRKKIVSIPKDVRLPSP
jgi:acyl-CoA thioesterase FadM